MAKWMVSPRSERVREMVWPEVPGVLIADTVERCREALDLIRVQPVVGVDVESYGANPKKEHVRYKSKALSIQFAGRRGPKVFVPMWTVVRANGDGTWDINPTGNEHLLDVFAEWLEDSRPQKVLHNAKHDRHTLANHGVTMRGFLGDTLVMDYLYANGEQLHGLKECMRRYFKEKSALDYSEVFREFKPLKKPRLDKETGEWITHGKQKFLPDLLDVVRTQGGVNKLIDYSVKDPYFTVLLYEHLAEKLRGMPWVKQEGVSLSYFDYYEKIERPYSDVLFDMEMVGAPIDFERLQGISSKVDADLEDLEREFMHICVNRGIKPSRMEKFNINSTAQVAQLLYGEMGMRCERITEGGQKSAGKTALEAIVQKKDRSRKAALDAEVVEVILRHRAKTTLRKMFVKPLMRFVPEYKGRVHSNFKQTGTATGRLSSATPNLENIPTGKKDDEYKLRSCFVAPPGYVVADIDLKQIEVRLTAHFTKDQTLIDLLVNGWDQHLIAMNMLFPQVAEFCGSRKNPNGSLAFDPKRPPDGELGAAGEKKFGKAQWGEWRRRAKILNFGIIYGMGPQGYVGQVGGGATIEDGKMVIANYFKGFPGLQRGIRRIQRKCHQYGYVKTLLKRYCMIPLIHSQDHGLRAAAERQAFNYVVQGSAADMIKLGMLLCWMDKRLRRWGVRMINQIHDEIVFIVKEKYVEHAKPIIEEYVSHPYRHTEKLFGVRMRDLTTDTPADLGVGPNWMEAKK